MSADSSSGFFLGLAPTWPRMTQWMTTGSTSRSPEQMPVWMRTRTPARQCAKGAPMHPSPKCDLPARTSNLSKHAAVASKQLRDLSSVECSTT
eukprot:6454923-Amphidinium_carterae.1